MKRETFETLKQISELKDGWRFGEGFKLIAEGSDGTNEEEERVQNGLLLFGKYYQSLWQ